MRIQRDYNQPFFRDRPKRRHLRRYFFIFLLLIGGMAYMVWTQPDRVAETVLRVIGPDVTPTPQPSLLATDAQNAFWAGDLEAAAELMAQATEMQPDNVDFLYEYGMILIDLDNGRNQNADQAIELASQIIQINPNDPRGYALRARGLVWTDNSSGAVPVAQAGIDIAPNFAPLYAVLSRAYIGQGKLREAQEAGFHAIELAPGDVRSYWAYASSLAFSGARDEAIIEYERTTDVHPGFLPPYFELAALYLAANRDQEAIDTYDRILGVQPRNSRAQLRQCEAYRKVGQFERAIGFCQDAVTGDPEYVQAQLRYGILLYRTFDFQGANDAFSACVDLEPGNLECTYRLGLSYYYLAKDEYRDICESQRLAPFDCGATETCQSGWDLLQDALVMAQNRDNTDADIEIIREGLNAISSDPACSGISGQPLSILTPSAEVTESATPEQEG